MSDGRRSRRVVAAILGVGWAVALGVFLSAAPAEEDPEVYDLEHSRVYERQLEIIGGKAAILGRDVDAFVGSLWHGRRLAATIAVGTAVAALVYPVATRHLGSRP